MFLAAWAAGHGISIGDEVSAGIYNVTFESIFLNGTRAGPRIKSKVRLPTLRPVVIRNIIMLYDRVSLVNDVILVVKGKYRMAWYGMVW